jgi:glycosyltransferase involved in cell wall biosynthesis
MNLPSVSVLVCSRNGGIKLARMLQSFQAQDLSLAEIILIDDGSDLPLAPICSGPAADPKRPIPGLHWKS